MARKFILTDLQKGEIALSRSIAVLNHKLKSMRVAKSGFRGFDYNEFNTNLMLSYVGNSNEWLYKFTRADKRNFYNYFSLSTLFGYNQFLGRVYELYKKNVPYESAINKAAEETKSFPKLFEQRYIKYHLTLSTEELRNGIEAVKKDLSKLNFVDITERKIYALETVYEDNDNKRAKIIRNSSPRRIPTPNPQFVLENNFGKNSQNEGIFEQKSDKKTEKITKSEKETLSLFDTIPSDGLYSTSGHQIEKKGESYFINGLRYDGDVVDENGNLIIPQEK